MSLEQHIQEQRERFHILFDCLSDTQWSATAVPEAKSDLATCQTQARLTKARIDNFNVAVDKEYKRLASIKGHGIRHIWYRVRGKLEEHLDEQEKTWLREFEQCKEEEQRLVVLQEEVQSAEQHLKECQNAYEEYIKTKKELAALLDRLFSGATPSYPDEDAMEQQTKKELAALLDRLFSGATPSYPDEDAMEQQLQNEKEHLVTIQTYHRVITHAFELMQKAHQALILCHRALDDALNMNTFDLFSDSSFADMAVSSYLAKARNASAQAQQFLNEARRLYPNMRHVGELHIKQDNLVFNILFDNIWTDMNMRKKIREASNRISSADAAVVSIVSELKQKLDQYTADRDKTRTNITRMATEHFKARINIVQNVIQPPPPYSAIDDNYVNG
ncbi:unnamed protein product [Rotaria magnacalcarata]|uniref:Uncharacterized protein n=3 Tax=Rotaria magnacalcarata TaxID=392030 RepID=A0A815FKG4_9BILA|nr:unnamed protein product [Rotaria magnacalcarata]